MKKLKIFESVDGNIDDFVSGKQRSLNVTCGNNCVVRFVSYGNNKFRLKFYDANSHHAKTTIVDHTVSDPADIKDAILRLQENPDSIMDAADFENFCHDNIRIKEIISESKKITEGWLDPESKYLPYIKEYFRTNKVEITFPEGMTIKMEKSGSGDTLSVLIDGYGLSNQAKFSTLTEQEIANLLLNIEQLDVNNALSSAALGELVEGFGGGVIK